MCSHSRCREQVRYEVTLYPAPGFNPTYEYCRKHMAFETLLMRKERIRIHIIEFPEGSDLWAIETYEAMTRGEI